MSRSVIFAMLVSCVSAACTDCSGHGDCSSNMCICEEGWAGDDCEIYKCAEHPDGCSEHGQCRTTGCVCHSGYGGQNCALRTNNCPDHCKGHGSCLDGACTCDRGYKGMDCGLVDSAYSCQHNCSGHGFCDTFQESPQCFCMPNYWSGPSCNILTSRCPPELNNCTGHGICQAQDQLSDDSPWSCQCEVGFTGDSCNLANPQCPNNCTGHGICNGTQCECNAGFTGTECNMVEAVEGCPQNCSGHGRCVSNGEGGMGCACDDGYQGVACVLLSQECPQQCSGKGECLANGECACIPGYNGTACQNVLGTCTAFSNCSANGFCHNGKCKCRPGFGGDDCSSACHTGGIADVGCNQDLGHGVCVDGTCLCKEGEWEGEGCEISVSKSTIEAVANSNNPLGIIALSVGGCFIFLVLVGFVYNNKKGKSGLNAVPGVAVLRSHIKGDV